MTTVRTAGFLGTRFAGTDGVSLEVEKWARVLRRRDIESFYFSGLSDRPSERCHTVPPAFFDDPEIRAVQERCFGTFRRDRALSREIRRLTELLKDELNRFLDRFRPDFLIPQNALAIPMNIPLGVAITEVIAETGLPVIAHHHDFAWERDRFRVCAVEDILAAAFPPRLPGMKHVVINREAQRQIAQRCGLASTVIPNVFDFAALGAGAADGATVRGATKSSATKGGTPAFPAPDEFNRDLRSALGIGPEQLLILQPTRMIARKGIEHALELAARLKHRAPVLVIPHQELDEGDEYARRILEYARTLGVTVLLRPDRITSEREAANDVNNVDPAEPADYAGKRYSLWDLYIHADLVTYPSLYEGFGNAFLEAVYFGKPIVVNRYSVYREDLEPLGFETVTMDGYVTDDVVRETETLLDDRDERNRRAHCNLEIARRHFSLEVLEERLSILLQELGLTGDQP